MRAKKGNSYQAGFFPRMEIFEKVIVDWVRIMRILGLGDEDVLFPSQDDLFDLKLGGAGRALPLLLMTSNDALSRFRAGKFSFGNSVHTAFGTTLHEGPGRQALPVFCVF